VTFRRASGTDRFSSPPIGTAMMSTDFQEWRDARDWTARKYAMSAKAEARRVAQRLAYS